MTRYRSRIPSQIELASRAGELDRFLRVTGAQNDARTVEEVYGEVLRRTDEFLLGRASLSQRAPADGLSLLRFMRDRLSFLPPWLLDDGDPRTSLDFHVRHGIDQVVNRTRKGLIQGGFVEGSVAYHREIALRLLVLLRNERTQGGLGIETDRRRRSYIMRDGVETYRAAMGDCNSTAFLYYAMARRAGLDVRFIRVFERTDPYSAFRQPLHHVAIGVQLDPADPSSLLAIDPSEGDVLDQTYRWYPISLLEMAAYHLRNVALSDNWPNRLPAAVRSAREETLLRNAAALSPRDCEIQLDLADFYEDRGDNHLQEFHQAQADAINPECDNP